ncbi:MAG TPA: tRNA (adenosine(37)-N6)-threonylcarbamoyltransferase complex dimerization subunit type 1 TsaB [Chitinispirillaceae bacterium]|nr:tRNA (adenosine(37)-N6)-threonylcarbamoyltransferase complex dimerization subunit type 1 TsaB [Chitinispirillaceae bacterium]
MSWILGIDTSSVDMGIGLFKNGVPVASYSRYIINSHAEHISQTVTSLLSLNSVAPEEIKRIAITAGPGSFTGLRIGIAFAKGFSFSNEALVCPVSSLHVLAHAARTHNGTVIAAIDARNGDVFWASFTCSNGTLHRLSEDAVCPIQEFAGSITSGSVVVSDTMGYKKSIAFTALPPGCIHIPIEQFSIQRGFICASIGASIPEQSGMWINEIDLHPNYLRSSAARIPSPKG